MSGPRIGELFAGYGGIGLGLKQLWPDAEIAWVSDIKKGSVKVLAHRYPDAPNLGDITKVDWSQVEPVDIITGGSPCQDLSPAGKRAGMKPGTRSGLWASMCDAIDILRPSLVVWENVRGALSAEATIGDVESCGLCMDDDNKQPMRALGRVLGDLADIGYDAAWVGLRAADVGACHGRFRVFVLAWPADADGGRRWQSDSNIGRVPVAHSSGHEPLIPTPRASDGEHGGPNQRGSRRALTVASAIALLPTPAVNDMGAGKTVDDWDAWTADMQSRHGNGNGHGKSLSIEAQRLPMLPTPTAQDSAASGGAPLGHNVTLTDATVRLPSIWGDYAPAIERHERAFGRPAPAHLEPTGKGGSGRLSPRFVEWMMGLSDGWITDVPGITRAEALSLCGDGVVPAQCAEAVRWLLDVRASERAA